MKKGKKNKKKIKLEWQIQELQIGLKPDFKVLQNPRVPDDQIWFVSSIGIKKFLLVETP